jgi:hypothetical protein
MATNRSGRNRKSMNQIVLNSPKWVIAALSLFSTTTLLATSIVALRRPTHIAIAADTLGRFLADNPNGERKTISHCKIHSSGGFFFALAGFTSDINSGFDTSPITAHALLRVGKIEVRSKRVVADIRAPLLKAVQRIYREASPEVAMPIIGDESHPIAVLQLLVFGVENGIPEVVSANFTRINNEKHEPVGINAEVHVCPGEGCKDGEAYWLLGEQDAIVKAINGPSVPIWTGNDAADVRKLVSVEIADKPKLVGPPIDVLIVDAPGGHHWLTPLGRCSCRPSNVPKPTPEKTK